MREGVRITLCVGLFGAAVAGVFAISAGQVQADDPNSAPNPYHVVEHWAKLPEGRMWGQAIGVDIDRDGTSLWSSIAAAARLVSDRAWRRCRNSMQPAARSSASARA